MRKKEVLAQELLGLKSPIFASFGGRAILVTSSRREARHVVPTSEDRGCVSLRKEVPIRNLRLSIHIAMPSIKLSLSIYVNCFLSDNLCLLISLCLCFSPILFTLSLFLFLLSLCFLTVNVSMFLSLCLFLSFSLSVSFSLSLSIYSLKFSLSSYVSYSLSIFTLFLLSFYLLSLSFCLS